MTTKKKSKKTGSTKGGRKKRGPIFDGAPITIGGGGGLDDKDSRTLTTTVKCSFNHGHYVDHNDPTGTTPKKRKFDHPGWQIKKLLLTFTGGQLDFTPLLPPDGDCTILVRCRDDSDTRERIKIYGSPFGIEFHTGKYPRKSATSDEHENPDATSYISRVEIDSEKFYFEKKFLAGDYCKVWTDME